MFFVGLIAAVRVMLYGVERQRPTGDSSPRSFSASPAVIASFAVVTGFVGYLLARSGVPVTWVWTVAFLAGASAAAVMVRLVRRWWTVVPEHDIDDERYVLQGSIARVVADIREGGIGQIALEGDGTRGAIPARAIDERAMPAGTEVVIERIEGGVAFVEDWTQVEKRL